MQEWIRRDRANQHGVRRKNEVTDMGVVRNRYARLMQVEIQHGYYANAESDGACPDFNAQPTPPTQKFMRSLGLIFFPEAAGFSILYDINRSEGLFDYLRRQGMAPKGSVKPQYWTRLSFTLSLNNLTFINFTEIPIDTNPTKKNFYFTNQDAHGQEPEIILNKEERVDGAALLPVEGSEVRVLTPPVVDKVVALDIAGQPVSFEVAGVRLPYVPRCVPVDGSPPTEVCRTSVYLDFATEDEDKYVICATNADGAPLWEWPIVYTTAEPNPLCFIDLLFSQPTATEDGIYPVQDLHPEDETAIVPVRYLLRFKARSTFWRYYIVPQSPEKTLDDLVIETMGEMPPVSFAGPIKVWLVNGAPAYCFISDERLLLQQQSAYRFRLKGLVRLQPAVDDVLVGRLPVAGTTQVLPEGGTEDPDKNYSDIYVYV